MEPGSGGGNVPHGVMIGLAVVKVSFNFQNDGGTMPDLSHIQCVTIVDAAAALKVSRSTIDRMIKEGRLESIAISRRCIRIPLRALERLLEPAKVTVGRNRDKVKAEQELLRAMLATSVRRH